MLRRSDIGLLVVGGAVDPEVGGCVDANAVQHVMRMNIDRCFIGSCAISPNSGISAFDLADATFKRAVLAASEHSMVLALSEKFDNRAAHKVAVIKEIECVVVEHDLPRAQRAALSKAGASVVQAQEPASP